MPRGHTRGKHTLANPRTASFQTVFHRRRIALLAAPVATVLAVGAGVLTTDLHVAAPSQASDALSSASSAGLTEANSDRALGTTRSTDRVALVPRIPKVTGKMWTTADLDLRTQPREKSPTAGELKSGKHVGVTGRHQGAYAEVVVDHAARWVTAEYLDKKKVLSPAEMGLPDTPCAGTSGVEAGLTSGAVRVYRAVCNNFPMITQYGGREPHGEHVDGKAIDIMTSDTSVGDEIAAFLQAHAAQLDLYDIIWHQHIWTPVRASEGWRSMGDRGSETANHYDHVHVSVN